MNYLSFMPILVVVINDYIFNRRLMVISIIFPSLLVLLFGPQFFKT
jgi:hypothetical protein